MDVTRKAALKWKHGKPSSAIDSSLSDLFSTPFANMCLAAIDGDERIYCNELFETIFLTAEECNYRLRDLGESPTQDIIGG